MARLFGTDGVRGLAGRDLTASLTLELSIAAARVLAATDGDRRPLAVVGRDPRASGEFLEAAVIAGLASTGVDVVKVGVLPTPAVAYLTGRAPVATLWTWARLDGPPETVPSAGVGGPVPADGERDEDREDEQRPAE